MLVGTPGADDPTPLRADHLFDLASLTKAFTTVAALRLVDDGVVDLDAPVREVLSVGSGPDADRITLRHLLTHTAGLPAECRLWREETGDRLRESALRSTLHSSPGERHRYSDVGFIAAGEFLEGASGRPLRELVAEAGDAMGARSLTWNPDPELAVATERQAHRGLVRGEVHDELAHALGRPAGHAGLFGTVDDVAALARMIREDGSGPGSRVLSSSSTALMSIPIARSETGYGQAVGLRVRERAWMGDAAAVGHTGFTGTCFAVCRASGGYGVLLVNRVHPSRADTDITAIRRRFLHPLAAVSGAETHTAQGET